MRVTDALAMARNLGVDRLDAQLLLAHHLGRPRSWLIAHDDAELTSADERMLRAAFAQRSTGVPVAYLVGKREFRGLPFTVTPAVLVPRPDTELLVDWALEQLPKDVSAEVVDLGTGSGAIAASLAHARPAWRITATDINADALAVAALNAADLGVQVQFILSDWWRALVGRRFDLAVSNPPYIAADDAHLSALQHEPRIALTPGGDGLGALRAVVTGAAGHLGAGGWLLLEHGHDQAAAVRALLRAANFVEVQTRRDLSGHERCSGGCLPLQTATKHTPPLPQPR